MSPLKRSKKRFGLERFALHMHPAAEGIVGFEMRVIRRHGVEPLSLAQELVEEVPSIAAVDLDEAAMVIDFDGMAGRKGMSVVDRKLRPGGMGDADEGSSLRGPLGKFRPGLFRAWRSEIERKPGSQYVPQFPDPGSGRVQLRAYDGGEAVRTVFAGIGDRPAVARDEMLRHLQEVITRFSIGADHAVEGQGAVRQIGMRMQIAAPEAAFQREGSDIRHDGVLVRPTYDRFPLTPIAACRARPPGRAECGKSRWRGTIDWPA